MAAGSTYTPIATTTLGSAQADVTFSSISSSYTDLVIVISGSASSTDRGIGVEFNGDTSANYSNTVLFGDGSAAGSARASSANKLDLGRVNTSISNSIIHIMNYANTTTYKTSIGRGNTNGLTITGVGLWRKTPEAINSIKLYAYATGSSQNFASGSTFTLYGIQAA